MYDPLLRDAVDSGEEDARFLAPLLTVTEAGRNLLISPSTVKDWQTRELVHSVAPFRRGTPTLPLAGVAEAQVLRGLRLSGLPPTEIARVTRSLREELGEYALIKERLAHDGRSVFRDVARRIDAPQWVRVRDGQLLLPKVVDDHLTYLEWAPDGFPVRLRLRSYRQVNADVQAPGGSAMTAASWPDHLLTLAEWDALPQDTSRCYELVEGVLLVVPRPAPLHQRARWRLCSQIEDQLPAELTVLPDVEVLVKADEPPTVRAPDIIITREDRATANPSRLKAADVLVAVEIISPGTGITDRVTKRYEYAGIPHYWLVDLEKPVTLTAYTLVDGNYEHVAGGIGTVTIPSPVGITLTLDTLITR